MPLSPGLAEWLVGQGHDAIHAGRVQLHRASDRVILQHAWDEQRIIITADLDYPRLLALAQDHGSLGLILFRGGNYSEEETIQRVKRVLDAVSDREIQNSIVVIEKARIRRRSFPL